MKYHIGDKGPSECNADKRACPLGGFHGSLQDVEKEYALQQHGSFKMKPSKLADKYLGTLGEGWLDMIQDPKQSSGLCTDSAEKFAIWADDNGYEPVIIEMVKDPAIPHTITSIDGITYDFTYSQFDEDEYFPLLADFSYYERDGFNIIDEYSVKGILG